MSDTPDIPARRILVADQTLVEGLFVAGLAVTVENGWITSIAPASELAPGTAVELLEGMLLVPSTLNAHNHSFQSLLRGVADDCDFFTWRDAWKARGHEFETITSFIGSDANAFRKLAPHLRALTISTGVEGEHTTEESIALAPLAELVEATVALVTDGR